MKKDILTRLFLFLFPPILMGCGSNQMKNKVREGYWVEKENRNNVEYESRGYYRNGEETRKWKRYEDGKLVKKEKYNNTTCTITYYDVNGKKIKKGKSKLDGLHWYYSGEWKTYDAKGKLSGIMIYDKGELIKELDAQKKEIPLTPLIFYTELNTKNNQ